MASPLNPVLTIGVTGDKELQEKLALVKDALNIEEIADEGAAILLARIRARFLSEVDPQGVPWVPSFAAKMRKARGRGGGTLFDTGRLFHSIQLFAPGPGTRTLGTNVRYARRHQDGIGQIRRQFLGMNDDDVSLITNRIKSRVLRALEGKKP